MPHQRTGGTPCLLARRRRRLQLLQLGKLNPLPILHALATAGVSGADELRNNGRVRHGVAEFDVLFQTVLPAATLSVVA